MAGIGSRHQIKILSVAPAKDANGFMKPAETVLYSGWAQVENPSGFRTFIAGLDNLGNTKTFRIRHEKSTGIGVNARVIYAGKTYAVQTVIRDREKKFYSIITATAKDNGRI